MPVATTESVTVSPRVFVVAGDVEVIAGFVHALATVIVAVRENFSPHVFVTLAQNCVVCVNAPVLNEFPVPT